MCVCVGGDKRYYSKSWPKKIIVGTPHKNALVAAETKEVWLRY